MTETVAEFTECDWHSAVECSPLLQCYGRPALEQQAPTVRKLRLFTAACYRNILNAAQCLRLEPTAIWAEEFADGLAALTDVGRFKGELNWTYSEQDQRIRLIGQALDLMGSLPTFPKLIAIRVAELAASCRTLQDGLRGGAEEMLQQACFARCILGNPFRKTSFDPRWRTEDVLGLARGIYEDRAFARLPILADALMDAGCDNEDVLAHCKSDGPHARGCWVVDQVLGKE